MRTIVSLPSTPSRGSVYVYLEEPYPAVLTLIGSLYGDISLEKKDAYWKVGVWADRNMYYNIAIIYADAIMRE